MTPHNQRSMLLAALSLVLVVGGAFALLHDSSRVPPPASSTAASGPAPTATVPQAERVILLYATDAVVAVSSAVSNAHDRPEHLVDHDEETAWNGKTDDLVGAWIAFRVPEDAHVDHLMMSAGFDKVSAKEDLFFANYRITRVRISRDGAVVKDAALSPDVRRPQRLDIDTAGGDFKIEVTAVVPGSHAGWREIAVSELSVLGTPGSNVRTTAGPPPVRVGGLDVRATATSASDTPTRQAVDGSSDNQCAFARSLWPDMVRQGTIATVETKGTTIWVTVHMDRFAEAWGSSAPMARAPSARPSPATSFARTRPHRP